MFDHDPSLPSNNYVRLAEEVDQQFKALTPRGTSAYINRVYDKYEKHINRGHDGRRTLERAMSTMDDFRNTLVACGDKALQEHGVGVVWNQVDAIAQPIRWVIGALGEMLCEAMLSPNELVAAYRTSSLSFQRDG
jgi:hypothetical protein